MQPAMASAIQSSCAMSGWLALDSTKATNRRSRGPPVLACFTECCAEAPKVHFVHLSGTEPRLPRNGVGAGVGGVRVLEDQLEHDAIRFPHILSFGNSWHIRRA